MLDVARFKYPPFWVPVEQLWEATLAVDEVTGRARGWFELSAAPLSERCEHTLYSWRATS